MNRNEFVRKLADETEKYVRNHIPSNIDGMNIYCDIEIDMFFDIPVIRFSIHSKKYEKHEVRFGVKFNEGIRLIPDRDGVYACSELEYNYYTARLINKVDEAFMQFCQQICNWERIKEEEHDSTEM